MDDKPQVVAHRVITSYIPPGQRRRLPPEYLSVYDLSDLEHGLVLNECAFDNTYAPTSFYDFLMHVSQHAQAPVRGIALDKTLLRPAEFAELKLLFRYAHMWAFVNNQLMDFELGMLAANWTDESVQGPVAAIGRSIKILHNPMTPTTLFRLIQACNSPSLMRLTLNSVLSGTHFSEILSYGTPIALQVLDLSANQLTTADLVFLFSQMRAPFLEGLILHDNAIDDSGVDFLIEFASRSESKLGRLGLLKNPCMISDAQMAQMTHSSVHTLAISRRFAAGPFQFANQTGSFARETVVGVVLKKRLNRMEMPVWSGSLSD